MSKTPQPAIVQTAPQGSSTGLVYKRAVAKSGLVSGLSSNGNVAGNTDPRPKPVATAWAKVVSGSGQPLSIVNPPALGGMFSNDISALTDSTTVLADDATELTWSYMDRAVRPLDKQDYAMINAEVISSKPRIR